MPAKLVISLLTLSLIISMQKLYDQPLYNYSLKFQIGRQDQFDEQALLRWNFFSDQTISWIGYTPILFWLIVGQR